MKIYTLVLLIALEAANIATQTTNECPEEADIQNCLSCENPDVECRECGDNFYHDQFDGVCLPCSSHCTECLDGDRDGEAESCLTCEPFFYLDTEDRVCDPCTGHCETCDDGFTCDLCEEGYRKEEDQSISCRDCPEGCLTCADSSAEHCSSCEPGYYYVAITDRLGECLVCSPRCELCTSGATCDQCTAGFTWEISTCEECVDHCASCDTAAGCQRCMEGFWLTTDGECRVCDHCAVCQDKLGCTECDDGYIQHEDLTCHPCPRLEVAEVCEECGTLTRGRVSVNGECLYCPEHCLSCNPLNTILCTSCEFGYILIDGECLACHENCVTCFGPTEAECYTCTETHGLHEDQCTVCEDLTGILNCERCDGTTCTDCIQGWYLSPTPTDNDHMCRPCISIIGFEHEEGCRTCADTRTGRYMTSFRCVGCDDYGADCLACSTSRCTLCSSGYFVDLETGSCSTCDDISNCLVCSDDGADSCLQCMAGYYLEDGICIACTANCDSCTDAATCNECSSEYFLFSDAICKECTTLHCVDCAADVTQCLACEDGYYHESNELCVECGVVDCATCDTAADTCDACVPSRLLYMNTCEYGCLENCADCSSASLDAVGLHHIEIDVTCDTCDDAYVKVTTTECYHCFDDCEVCSADGSTCTSCYDGYYWDGSECLDCDSSCETCSGGTSSDCDSCREDAYSSGAGQCTDCNANCATCGGSPNTCLTCHFGATLNSADDGCYSCHDACVECSGPSSSQCNGLLGSPCNDGYYSDGGDGCLACDSSCVTCDGGTSADCLDCPVGEFSDSGTCTACDSDCLTCDGTSNADCLTCIDGRFVSGGGTCDDCHEDCHTCDGATNTDCLTCYGDEYLDTDSSCTYCHCNCETCDGPDRDNCLSCFGGCTLNPVDNECYECDISCLTCDSDTSDTDCVTCFEGDWDNSGDCEPCDSNCATCAGSATTCLTCPDDMILNTMDDVCYDCSSFSYCAMCDASTCLTCNAGYFDKQTDVCTACPANCAECSDPITCTLCVIGYGLVMDCLQCNIDLNCEYCDGDPTDCSTCSEGYRDVGPECEACDDPNCLACPVDAAICTDCALGYIVDTDDTCLVCPPLCADCMDTISCTTCLEGYATSTVCQSCLDSNCLSCTDAETCTECAIGYYLQSERNICSRCTTRCHECTEEDGCIICDDGYQLEADSCEQRPLSELADCVYDNGEGECTECDEHFFLDPYTHECVECDGVDPNSAEYVCSECVGAGGGHHVVQSWFGECDACPFNCISCDSPYTCNECKENYFTDGAECFVLPCDSLSSIVYELACTLCHDYHLLHDDEYRGLFWTGSQCLECVRNCELCESSHTCDGPNDRCREHYVWDSDQGLCVECDLSTEEECVGCVLNENQGRFIDEAGLCLLCDIHCTRCGPTSDVCTQCDDDTYLDGTTCNLCGNPISTPGGCAECNTKYYDWTAVHLWIPGPAGDDGTPGESGCYACPTNCEVCAEINTCSQCQDGTYFYTDPLLGIYECRECMDGCELCSAADTCEQCLHDYYYVPTVIDGNSCRECPVNCAHCTHEHGCLNCTADTFLTVNKLCDPCSTTIPNCVECQLTPSGAECDMCLEGFYPFVTGVTASCQSCVEHCLRCAGPDDCDECETGYCYDERSGKCRDHIGRDCLTCQEQDGGITCMTCKSHRFLDVCQPCADEECIACNADVNRCELCEDGFYVNAEDKCEACVDNCVKCTLGSSCLTCEAGYFYSEARDVCQECPEMCSSCKNDLQCTECIYQNMYIDTSTLPNTCNSCFEGCRYCPNAHECSSCYTGYTSVRETVEDERARITTCLKCPDGCEQCIISSDNSALECLQCEDGWFMSAGGGCIDCSGFRDCAACNDTDADGLIAIGECTECSEGFYMTEDEDSCLECNLDGCDVCEDKKFVCDSCATELEPNDSGYNCATPCWSCENHDECGTAPVVNGTELAFPQPGYNKIGCLNGCWTISETHGEDDIRYIRGCKDADTTMYECSMYGEKLCNSVGEGEEEYTECAVCCEGSLCNTAELGEAGSHATQITTNSLFITIITLVTVVISYMF